MAKENPTKNNPTTDGEKENGVGALKKKGMGLISKLNGLFNKSEKPEGIKSDDFRREKKVMSNYKDVIEKEKDKRKEELPGKEIKKEEKKDTEEKQKLDLKVAKNQILKKISKTDRWKAPKIIKTNLIKGEVTTIVNWNKNVKVLIPSAILPVIIIILLYGALLVWENRVALESEALGGEIMMLNQQIKQVEKDVVIVDAFEKKLKIVSELLEKHIYWTNFYKFLEDNVIEEARILGGFSGTPTGDYRINLQAKTYENIADQVLVFEANEMVESVNVESGSVAEASEDGEEFVVGVKFPVELKLDTNIFYKE